MPEPGDDMIKNTTAVLGVCFVAALVILIVALPVSGLRGSGHHDGTGYQHGNQTFQNGTCQGYHETGLGNMSCLNASCPNNGTPLRDGTGQRCGQSGESCVNGSHSEHRGQGCTNQSRA